MMMDYGFIDPAEYMDHLESKAARRMNDELNKWDRDEWQEPPEELEDVPVDKWSEALRLRAEHERWIRATNVEQADEEDTIVKSAIVRFWT